MISYPGKRPFSCYGTALAGMPVGILIVDVPTNNPDLLFQHMERQQKDKSGKGCTSKMNVVTLSWIIKDNGSYIISPGEWPMSKNIKNLKHRGMPDTHSGNSVSSKLSCKTESQFNTYYAQRKISTLAMEKVCDLCGEWTDLS